MRILFPCLFVFWLFVGLTINGCDPGGLSGYLEGDPPGPQGLEFVGTVYSSTSLIDPETADADLCAIPPLQKYVNKFRDGIHPDSGRGPVILLSPHRPDVSQLFDGSDWRTDWRWYRATREDIVFYFDEDMPPGLTSSQVTQWFKESLPLKSKVGNCTCTLYSYERDAIGAALSIIINW